ncbi:HAD family hydrolase [Actinomycetaceae bacterium MB13-C1-2]|nr:HAD family hydrolase [Actinomycetaceae bacterium MB13-C1-2]
MSRLVFLDVDGTLLNDDQQLPDSAREALTAAVAGGHRLVLCTGRSKVEIYQFLWDIGFRDIVALNGAYAEVDGTPVLDVRMPQEELTEISEWLMDKGIDHYWLTGTNINTLGDILKVFIPPEAGGDSAADWSAYLTQIEPYVRVGVPESAPKTVFAIPSDAKATLEDVQEHFGDRYEVIPGSLRTHVSVIGELGAPGMNKSVGMMKIAEKLGVPIEETIAIGDSDNDIEMLSVAGTSVAMGDGVPAARAAADWVTAGVDEGGLALAFERLGLLES